MWKEYIWDFDGMLFDSYPHIATAYLKMCKDFNISTDYDDIYKKFKISYGEAYGFFKPTEEQIQLFRSYENDMELQPLVLPYPYIYDVLKSVTKNGGRNFLFTHRNDNAIAYLKKYNLDKYFTEFVTSDNGFAHKPSPDAINYLVNKYSLDKKATIMIGDREIDVLSGKNAGVYACLFDEDGIEPETAADLTVNDIKLLIIK